jgi:probable phosphoglycerate mutase
MHIVAFFVRHGETDLNDKDAFRGDLNVPLNDLGHAQAEALVPYFAARQFSAAFHSGMQRTKQTLEPLMHSKGMKSFGVERLNSLDTGEFAGKPKNKKNRKLLEYYREHPEEKIPGGESVGHFRRRVDPKIMAAIRIGDESGMPTISSIHGSVMREISRLLHNDYNKVKVEPGGVVGIFKTPNGYMAEALLKESDAEEDIKAGS